MRNLQNIIICCGSAEPVPLTPDDYYIVPSDEERERYLGVFRKIFEKMGHIDHYNMMMGIKGIES